MDQFIDAYLARLLPGEALELRTLQPGTGVAVSHVNTDGDALKKFARYYDSLGWHVYYGLNPRNASARTGRRENITRGTCVWADLDAKDYANGKEGARAAIDGFVLAPSLLIDSGGGYQAVWYLDPATTTPQFSDLEAVVKRLAQFLGADNNVADVTRIFRLPDTHNTKYDPAPLVKIIQHIPGTLTLSDFTDIFPAPTPAPTPPPTLSPTEWDHQSDEEDWDLLVSALQAISPDKTSLDYREWVSVLMAIHSAYPGPQGLDLAEAWGAGKPGEIAAKWRSFRGEGATLGTVFFYAHQRGWTAPAATGTFEWTPPETPVPTATSESRPASGKLHIINMKDYLAKTFNPQRWLVEDLLAAASFSLLAAKQKLGKSTLAVNLGWAIATGKPFLGRRTQQGRVLYISYEQGEEGPQESYALLRDAWGATDDDMANFDLHLGWEPIPTTVAQLTELLATTRYDLIIIDPLSKGLAIENGNDYQEVGRALAPILALAMANRTHVMCLHHAHKAVSDGADAVMGSMGFAAAVEATLMLRRDLATNQILFSTENRWSAPINDQVIDFDERTRHATLRGDLVVVALDEAKRRILAYLSADPEATLREIKDALAPMPEHTVANALRELIASMRVGASTDKPPRHHAISWSPPAPVPGLTQSIFIDQEEEAK